MKGLNLKHFKKISDDKTSAMLQHPDGHQIRIAKAALSPGLLETLNQLPSHGTTANGAPKFAQGGVAESEGGGDTSKGVTINFNGPAPGQPQQAEQAPDKFKNGIAYGMGTAGREAAQASPGMFPLAKMGAQALGPAVMSGIGNLVHGAEDFGRGMAGAPPSSPDAQASAEPGNPIPMNSLPAGGGLAPPAPEAAPQEQAPDQQAQAPAQEPQAAPQMPSAPPAAQTFEQHKQHAFNELNNEIQTSTQDINEGHIEPKTYSSMFAKKDVLGKVGSLFGLMLSGAGSGLAHQQNAMLAAMNQEINNDLEAQKQNAGNKQNFLKINQQALANQAGIAATNQETAAKAWALSKAQMNAAALHSLSLQTQSLPQGSPQKQQAEQVLGMLYNTVQSENYNLADRAASASAYYKMMLGSPQQGGSNEQAFQQRTNGLRMLGKQGEERAKDMEEKHFPGIPGQASAPLSSAQKEKLSAGVVFDQKLDRFRNWASSHSGDLSPSDKKHGTAMAAELAAAYRTAREGGVYKEGEQHFINKLIDPNPTKFFNNIRVMPSLNAIAEEHKAVMDTEAKNLGFPGYKTAQNGSSQQQAPAKQTGTYQGKPVILRNGKWEYR